MVKLASQVGAGAHFTRPIRRRSDLERLDTRLQRHHDPVRGLVAHRNRDRHAALACRSIFGAHQRVGGRVHVGIGMITMWFLAPPNARTRIPSLAAMAQT